MYSGNNTFKRNWKSQTLDTQDFVSSSFEGGFPHSEIHGSKGARPSPRLIAACHVLHRLLPPRHPSNALETLDCSAPMHGENYAHRHEPLLDYNAGDFLKPHCCGGSALLHHVNQTAQPKPDG
jgi:hypothetical protein